MEDLVRLICLKSVNNIQEKDINLETDFNHRPKIVGDIFSWLAKSESKLFFVYP